MTERNLTKERQLAYLRRQKAEALRTIGKSETLVVATVKRDKKGNEVLDADGVPEIVDKRVLKSAYIAAEHDARIAAFAESGRLI